MSITEPDMPIKSDGEQIGLQWPLFWDSFKVIVGKPGAFGLPDKYLRIFFISRGFIDLLSSFKIKLSFKTPSTSDVCKMEQYSGTCKLFYF